MMVGKIKVHQTIPQEILGKYYFFTTLYKHLKKLMIQYFLLKILPS
jgi:hypothetical protein